MPFGQTILMLAQKHGGKGWKAYDTHFCQLVDAGHSLPWTELNPSMMAADVLQSSGGRGRSAPYVNHMTIVRRSVLWLHPVWGTIVTLNAFVHLVHYLVILDIPYRWCILRGKIFANFAFLKKSTQKTKIYIVHTLFLTDWRKFNPVKYTTYTVLCPNADLF